MQTRSTCLIAALMALALAGCERKPASGHGSAMSAHEADAALDNALNADDGGAVSPDEETAEGGLIPAAFQGRWSASAASCDKPGDDMRLRVSADSLTFYESVGKVTSVDRLTPERIRLTADYEGEGDIWAETSTLTLGDGGAALTIGKVKRVRCR